MGQIGQKSKVSLDLSLLEHDGKYTLGYFGMSTKTIGYSLHYHNKKFRLGKEMKERSWMEILSILDRVSKVIPLLGKQVRLF